MIILKLVYHYFPEFILLYIHYWYLLTDFDHGLTNDEDSRDSFNLHAVTPLRSSDCPAIIGETTEEICVTAQMGVADDAPLNLRARRKLFKNKELRQSGLPYFTRKGKYVDKKSYKTYSCNCKLLNCKDLKDEERKTIFESFWNLKNWQI